MLERLQKIIANAGLASRRAAEDMIVRGQVTVNGERVDQLGAKADPDRDHIKVKGKLINPLLASSGKRYLLVNKPKGYLSSASDPRGRPLVMELVPPPIRRGLHPIGRLDFNTDGLIILTNDGELTDALTKKGRVEKAYHVKVKGSPTEEQLERLRRGVVIRGARTDPARISLIEKTKEAGNAWYEVILREGKNQQIRRMFDSTGHSVVKLRRVRIGHVTDKDLSIGQYRELTSGEVKRFFQPDLALKNKRPIRKKAGRR